MRSLCADAAQEKHLAKLIGLIRAKTLTGTEAWSSLSAPQSSKTFKLSNGTTKTVPFTPAERKTYNTLRQLTQKKLLAQYGRACSYCRRPVGHYGYSWHIEHVLPKSIYPSLTFKLSNFTIGCVDCNRWKGARVDKNVKNKKLLIINPLLPGFNYSNHLRYFQIGTEDISFAKYKPLSPEGIKTYDLLNLNEIERAHAINSVDPLAAALHERFTQAMSAGLNSSSSQEFLDLLSQLKTSIYKRT